MATADRFAKDLGYLRPFLDRVNAAADALPPAAGEELRALMKEEQSRWARITELLGGAPVAPSRQTLPSVSRAAQSFTVGSLRPPR